MPIYPLLHIDPYPSEVQLNNRTKTHKGHGERNNLFLCPVCDQVWQTFVDRYCSQNWEYLWNGFPKIGAEKNVCPECIKKSEKKGK